MGIENWESVLDDSASVDTVLNRAISGNVQAYRGHSPSQGFGKDHPPASGASGQAAFDFDAIPVRGNIENVWFRQRLFPT